MASSVEEKSRVFQWIPQPEAADFVAVLLGRLVEQSPALEALARRMRAETGTRLVDWIDHFELPDDKSLTQQLDDLAFVSNRRESRCVYSHPHGMFPTVVIGAVATPRVIIKVESVADFLAAQGIDDGTRIEGPPLAPVRRARAFADAGAEVWAIERHGDRGLQAVEIPCETAQAALAHAEMFRRRKRDFARFEEGFAHATKLIRAAQRDLGIDWACDLFFAAEREYWQRRNRAAQIQKARQDRLGLGWANHDHHTYRSSREGFAPLIETLEALGFACRERFYAGREAGWGAQVLEQAATGVVIFADVDLSPEEVSGDFAHEPLAPRSDLGTVGLWCKLHGEAFLQAGMHHLECQFDFEAASEQLIAAGVAVMKPFTDFPHLKQAFTQGETWPVAAARIDAALADGSITADQAEQFRAKGAVGSHLEILERNEGYKGFNQTGISDIIQRTDPRHGS